MMNDTEKLAIVRAVVDDWLHDRTTSAQAFDTLYRLLTNDEPERDEPEQRQLDRERISYQLLRGGTSTAVRPLLLDYVDAGDVLTEKRLMIEMLLVLTTSIDAAHHAARQAADPRPR